MHSAAGACGARVGTRSASRPEVGSCPAEPVAGAEVRWSITRRKWPGVLLWLSTQKRMAYRPRATCGLVTYAGRPSQ